MRLEYASLPNLQLQPKILTKVYNVPCQDTCKCIKSCQFNTLFLSVHSLPSKSFFYVNAKMLHLIKFHLKFRNLRTIAYR